MVPPAATTRKLAARPPPPTSRDVKEQNGLEVPRQLQWVKWSAGGEFVKVLCVKNVSTDVINFTYKLLPHHSAFSVEYPESRRLSPGMSATIKVAFRPSIRQPYADELQLLSGTSSITVPLSAVLPASKLQLPATVDFGCVPVRQSCTQRLPIKNVGDAGLRFAWKLQEPFAVVPASGQLAPGETLVCEVHFQPQEAAAFRVAAACSLDNGELLTVKVNGMAKFPFLSLESDCVDLGDVVIGQTAEACVRFGNHSPVPAHFFLAAGPGSHDGTIAVQPSRGTLQPNEYSMLRVLFTPRATGAFSCESFALVTEGGNKLALTCKGMAVAPRLRLSARVFAFGSVKSGHTPSKTLYLENDSDLPVHYQFLIESGGVFTLTRPHGVVRPRTMAHTGVKFTGSAPGNYWRRVVCLIKDGEPQAIDVLASCYDDTSRPPLLGYKHIQTHLSRVAAGQGLLQLAATESLLEGSLSGQLQLPAAAASSDGGGTFGLLLGPCLLDSRDDSGCGLTIEAPAGQFGLVPSLQQQQSQLLAGADSWQVLFEGLEAQQPAVTVSNTMLDFGCCSRLSPAEPQSFQVTNCTSAKLVVSLVVPAWSDPIAGSGSKKALQQVFTTFPGSLELHPHATGTFRLAFRPPRDGQYYCQTVTLMSSIKAMRSFRLVQDHQVVPPWTCVLLACGNTFANLNPELSPKVSLSSSSISFPPCHLGEAVHQTLSLINHGDTPVHYAFSAPAGYAAGSQHSAAATPSAAQPVGSATAAYDGGGGSGGTTAVASSNNSCVKAGLVAAGGAWFGQFAVLPVQGVLEPKGQQLVALQFRPCDLNPVSVKLSCTFNHSASNSTTVMLSGGASEPRLVWDVPDNRLFFRPTCVGASSQRQLTVRNASKVPVAWQWAVSRKLQDAVTLAPMGGLLRGYESVKVTAAFSPLKQGVYNARAALLLLPPVAAAAALPPPSAAGGASCSAAAGVARSTSLLHVTPTAFEYGQAAAADLDAGDETQQEQSLTGGRNSSRLACQKLTLTIVGEATQGALCIEPASLSFGSIHVGYAQHKPLRLINQSSGVLRYHVTVTVSETDDLGGVDASEVACDFGSGAAVLPGSTDSSSSSNTTNSNNMRPTADCWLDAPEGLVNARSSKPVTLWLMPRRRGRYCLRLNLHAAPVPQLPRTTGSLRSLSAGSNTSSSPTATTPPPPGRLAPTAGGAGAGAGAGAESLLRLGSPAAPANCTNSPRSAGAVGGHARLVKSAGGCAHRSSLGAVRQQDGALQAQPGQGTAAAAAVSSEERQACDMLTVADASSACDGSSLGHASMGTALHLDRPPLATAAITAEASFPSLLLTDVYCEQLPKQVSWQTLGLSQLNAELRCPVGAAEVQAQQLADKGQLSNSNAASLLPPFQLDLGVAPACGSPQEFWVEFTNDGVLPVHWELHSYDAPQVDLENWVEAARPLTDAEKDRAFIINNNIFEVSPRHGCLPPGQSQQVCLCFNPVAEGAYCLPMFLRIKDGKQLQLQLTAKTVAPSAQLALAVRGSHSCLLAAAPIGEMQPPLQQYTLRNAGPAPLQYSLDISPLQELAKQNFSVEIITYAGGSPLSGAVPPGGVAVFNWLFQPLEAKAYSAALPLSLGSLPPQPLLIHGRGYHPTQQPQQTAPTAEEAAQHWQNWLGFSQHPAATAHNRLIDNESSSSNSCCCQPGRWLLSSPEVLDLGVCLPASTAKQLLTLTNTAAAQVEFAWQLGVFEEGCGIMSGRLAVVPMSGVLEPGEARVCQVSFEAGLQPQLFSGELHCHAAEVPRARASPSSLQASASGAAAAPAAAAGLLGSLGLSSSGSGSSLGAHGLTLEQWQTLGAADELEAESRQDGEEIIAQHPARQVLPPPGKGLRARLPLHLSMTESTCNRFETLKQRYQRTMLTRRTVAASAAAAASSPHHQGGGQGDSPEQQQQLQQLQHRLETALQLLTVTVQGVVLCKAHINAGSYIRPQELPRARKLLAVAHLLPSVQQPVSLLPPHPGVLGPSAAAAKAAHVKSTQQLNLPQPSADAQQAKRQDSSDQLSSSSRASSSPASTLLQQQKALCMAGAVLEQVLADTWADEDVISAFSTSTSSCVGGSSSSNPQQETLQSPEFHAFAEFVLNSAVLGTLLEGGVGMDGVVEEEEEEEDGA